MGLRLSYTLLTPIYDLLVEPAFRNIRQQSFQDAGDLVTKDVLLVGIGTGLDIPHLPPAKSYTGIDITPSMLKKAERRAKKAECPIQLDVGDAMAMPYQDDSFDVVFMHLILAVVPNSGAALSEATRVLRAGGQIIIIDKFIKRGQLAVIRRLLNIFMRHIATRTDVIFETLLEACPELIKREDIPLLASGWFRRIVLQKK
ncbi:MAG: class I SAM-dependent methyltransferase [Gammaproteobacteria bacterium]|nr:class I SAM-dependent methyltransferase [Gammaproteobacteria bacterium]